ncbi:hypothetical protein TCON_2381 [Astathelohania contejeani]|uniref:LAGLIDADG homing endonuclease n=1 Tax=Astathelohania contejeani TaxID=164912 RepID=A0ABQ7HW58_9MICR|nr:hypothetical protein TCON_2381 [Thelohania contejeani]
MCIYERYPKITVYSNNISHPTDHFLFIDDLKLFQYAMTWCKAWFNKQKFYFDAIGLQINPEISATNKLLYQENAEVYKYLGIIENKCGSMVKESFKNVRPMLH